MTADAAPQMPYYDHLVANVEKAMAALELVGLEEELKSLREYVNEYAREHRGEFDQILKGMRLIMQMVLAQHRIGADRLAESYEAMDETRRHLQEQFKAPDSEDV